MAPFVRLEGPAAPIAQDNVDTDILYPARFLLRMEKTGLGDLLFHDRRFTPEGAERAGFVLNRAPWRTATILVAILVDLDARRSGLSGGESIGFAIEASAREALMMGWDATDMILRRERSAIATFERRHRAAKPWLFTQGACP